MLFAVPVLVVALLSGCAAGQAEPDSWYTPGALKPSTSTPTPTVAAEAPVAAAPAPPPAAAPAPAAPASVDYVGPVTTRWGKCFTRLGVGDIYYDSTLGVVTAAWNGGVLTWAVNADRSGVPADQGSVDALAGC